MGRALRHKRCTGSPTPPPLAAMCTPGTPPRTTRTDPHRMPHTRCGWRSAPPPHCTRGTFGSCPPRCSAPHTPHTRPSSSTRCLHSSRSPSGRRSDLDPPDMRCTGSPMLGPLAAQCTLDTRLRKTKSARVHRRCMLCDSSLVPCQRCTPDTSGNCLRRYLVGNTQHTRPSWNTPCHCS